MPGIVGLQTNMPREWAETQLRRMVQAIQHESFYVSGVWAEESLGVYVGWVARGNSFADCMPVHNERGDVTLVFSGEAVGLLGPNGAGKTTTLRMVTGI